MRRAHGGTYHEARARTKYRAPRVLTTSHKISGERTSDDDQLMRPSRRMTKNTYRAHAGTFRRDPGGGKPHARGEASLR